MLPTRTKSHLAIILAALLLAPFAPLYFGRGQVVEAKTTAPPSQPENTPPGRKIAPDLQDDVDNASNGKNDRIAKVIIQLSDKAAGLSDGDLQSKLARSNGKSKNRFNALGLMTAEIPLSRIRDLEYDDDIAYVSPDRPVVSHGHLENTIAAAQEDARSENTGFTSLNGTGVGIAVLDSGVDDTHNLIKASTGRPAIVYSKTYTSIAANRDYFGHGTHVASLLMGNPGFKSDYYGGIAFESKIVSLGVLDAAGSGVSSNVVAAIDWCITNKATYNIRIINMSLGAPAKDSYKNDPLCLAVRRAYNAGIVVFVAAGNRGKNSLGQKIYGGIDSPGIEPSAITVGATNTFGTDTRTDDKIATYSSRGPTRGYYKDLSGLKHYDNLIKPDIVAPGNKLIGAISPSSVGKSTSLITLLPSLKTGGSSVTTDQVMYLSGTSMATPVVAGVAAMMLEANPNLTPGLVKAILMYTAQPLRGFNTLEQGAGEVNAEGAVRVAGWVSPTASSLSQGSSMLSAWDEYNQGNTISSLGERLEWGRGIVTNYCILYGSALMTKWQGMYSQSRLLAEGTYVSNGVLVKNVSLVTSGVSNTAGPLTNNGVLISDGVLVSDGVLIGDGVLISDGVLIGDGVLISDGVLVSDYSYGDQTTGDGGSCMQAAP